MNEIIKQSTELYYEIDDCITRLIKARLDKDANKENVALFDMESLLINTMQHISWMVNELKGNSQIKWQTGEPERAGAYLLTLKDGSVAIEKNFPRVDEDFFNEYVVAWCHICDIEPYKEKTK